MSKYTDMLIEEMQHHNGVIASVLREKLKARIEQQEQLLRDCLVALDTVSSPEDMGDSQVAAWIDQVAAIGRRTVELFGGEQELPHAR